ncbi:unnamed protein product [Durusdinium trenchii]
MSTCFMCWDGLLRKPRGATPQKHPQLGEQEEAMKAALAFVTEGSALASLLNSNDMSLVHFELWPENHPDVPGRLFNNNAIFIVTARAHGTADVTNVELVLRILNCHAWRKGRNGQSEVATLKLLEAHAMPCTPRVIDFAVDAATSPLKCEFILMEKLPGIQLRKIWADLSISERAAYLQQLKDWLTKLHEIPRPQGAGGPLASFRLVDGKVVADQPIVLVDGPSLPQESRNGFCDYATAIIEDACCRMPMSDLRVRLKELVKVDLQEYARKHEYYGVAPEYLRLCHNDLNLSNILCDPQLRVITGVVDWEGASWGFTDQDALEFQEHCEGNEEILHYFPTAPGETERRNFLVLLRDVPGLHFFNATWYGAIADASQRQAASIEEGKSAEHAVWQWFERKGKSELTFQQHPVLCS